MTAEPLAASRTVGVLGAGTMGAGIAWVAAEAGHLVRLFDTAEGAVDRALDEMRARLDSSVAKGRRTAAEADGLVGRIVPTSQLAEMADAALVIEAIVERLDIKQAVFGELETIVPSDTVLATNTSSLSVTAIAAGLDDPSRMVGMHFFNPAPVMPLVEIVSGADTCPAVAAGAYATAAAWGKSPVYCMSTPGFIVNRVARPYYAESLRMLAEGIADEATIDALALGAGGFAMGPFTLMDLVGLDVNLAVSKSVYEQTFHDARFAPNVSQQAKVDAGHLGRKAGRGWYEYGSSATPSPATEPEGPPPVVAAAPPDLGLEEGLAARLEAAGVLVERSEMAHDFLEVDGVRLYPTDGRPACVRFAETPDAAQVLFDLVLDWDGAERIAISAAPTVEPAALAAATGLFQAAGLAVSRVDDAPGLVLMRIVAQLISVAADAALAGVATPEDIDTAMRLGTHYPGGPFEWADRIGAARLATVLGSLRRFYGEDRYRTSPVITRACYEHESLRDQITTVRSR